jgi:hypothetical protein
MGKTITGTSAVTLDGFMADDHDRRLFDIANGWNDARARLRKGGI